jgi:hypothetical protein
MNCAGFLFLLLTPNENDLGPLAEQEKETI